MSGFAGIVKPTGHALDGAQLAAFSQPLVFRGPAGLATLTDGTAGFVLSLLHTASTSVHSIPRLDDSTWVVGDVRLDGKAELISRFDPADRLTIAGLSDAELILHSYRRWGDNYLAGLAGDFSFAIWDGARRRLLAARDPLGVKPFFFTVNDDRLVFSNTLQCVRAYPGVPADLDPLAVADFLLFGSRKDSSATAFSAIRRLPAGHSLVYESGAIKVRRYWTPEWGDPVRYRRPADQIEHFSQVLQQAVNDRVTLPRTAMLMSGGLDSTAVAAAARTTQTQIKAFTVVYDHLIPDEERNYSGLAATFLDTPIEYLAADDFELYSDAAGREPLPPEPVDEPLANVFLSHMRQVQSFSSVALSGQGGDAIFATTPGLGVRMLQSGHLRDLTRGAWQYLYLRRRIPPLGFRGSLKRLLSVSPALLSPEYPGWLNPEFESRFHLRERWLQHQAIAEPQAAHDVILDPFWSNLLEGYDAGITGVPLEVRHPLLDMRVVRCCLSADPLPWSIDKTMLRLAMQGRLPEAILSRPKSPVCMDPVAIRLPHCNWIDTWRPCVRLAEFVARERLPSISTGSGAPIPNLRPLALNRWLTRLDGNVLD